MTHDHICAAHSYIYVVAKHGLILNFKQQNQKLDATEESRQGKEKVTTRNKRLKKSTKIKHVTVKIKKL